MANIKNILFFSFLITFSSFSQTETKLDSIQELDEVVLSDVKLKRFNKGYKLTVLNDSILKKNSSSLTDVLRFNTNIYFKENGYGMVSSPSFRGTNASQTAVIWNGININSHLNGQIDFNTMTSSNYNSIEVRSGGGSVQYGSGAIGGTVHMSNSFDFSNHFSHDLSIGYGSFNTKEMSYAASLGRKKLSSTFGIAYRDSDNDYKILGTDKTNENSAFDNLDINFNLAYILSDRHVLKLYHQNFRSNRELSSTLVAPSRSKYEDENYRSMLEWAYFNDEFTSNFKVVHLSEQYKYFENKNTDNYSKGKANTWLFKYNIRRDFSKKVSLNFITDYSIINGEGDNFSNPNRNAFSATAVLDHRVSSKFQYTFNIRQDIISDFNSPLVFSGDLSYKPFSFYTLKLNASKNFRVPTFNDLYWNPGGNLDLEPEKSYQFDLGHELIWKAINFKLNTFYIKSKDLIQWQPQNGTVWSPVNIASTEHYGLEAEISLKKQFNKHTFLLSSSYSFTKAKDLEKNQPLIYVPEHKANASLSYNYKNLTAFYQHLYNGEAVIIGNTLTDFDVANFGVSYSFNNKKKVVYTLDFKINNLYDTYYENVSLRPMPNRNFNIKLKLKI